LPSFFLSSFLSLFLLPYRQYVDCTSWNGRMIDDF
jgi:hypothetical protein